MNDHERKAWRTLLYLGATHMDMFGKHCLKLTTVKLGSEKRRAEYIDALIEVAGRSGANRRHVDRYGRKIFVVTDDDLGPLPVSRRIGRRLVWTAP